MDRDLEPPSRVCKQCADSADVPSPSSGRERWPSRCHKVTEILPRHIAEIAVKLCVVLCVICASLVSVSQRSCRSSPLSWVVEWASVG